MIKYKYFLILILACIFLFFSCKTVEKTVKLNEVKKKSLQPSTSYYYYFLGLDREDKGDLSGAIKFFKLASEKDKKSPIILEETAACYAQLKDITNTIFYLKQAENIAPKRIETKFLLSDAYLLNKQYYEALKKLKEITVISPTNSEAYFEAGTVYQDLGYYDSALSFYQKSLELKSTLTAAIYNSANIYFKKNQKRKSLEYFKKLVDLNPSDDEVLFIYSFLLKKVGDYKSAETNYLKLFKVYPNNHSVIKELTELYYLINENKNSMKYLNMLSETNMEPLYNGIKYEINNEDLRAKKYFLDTLNIDTNNLAANYGMFKIYKKAGNKKIAKYYLINLGYISAADENFAAAIKFFKKANRMDKKDISIYHKLIGLYTAEGEYEKAVKEANNVLKYDSNNKLALYNLGLLYSILKKYKKSIFCFKKLIKIDSNFFDVYAQLGGVYFNVGDYKNTVQALKKALELNPAVPEVYFKLGITYLILKDYENGVKILKKGAEFDKKDYLMFFYLATGYDKINNKKKAIENLESVLKLNPNFADANNYLAYLYAELGINLDKALSLVKKAIIFNKNNYQYIDTLGWIYYKKGDYKRAYDLILKAEKIMKKKKDFQKEIADHLKKIKKKLKERKNE